MGLIEMLSKIPLKERVILLISYLVLIFIFLGIPYWNYSQDGEDAVRSNELLGLRGEIQTIRKTTTTSGRYGSGKPFVELSVKGFPVKFVISDDSYRAAKPQRIMAVLHQDVEIDFWVKRKSYRRSLSSKPTDKLLNAILKWRKRPNIYALKSGNEWYLNISEFNSSRKEFNIDNLFWGFLGLILVTGRLIWALCREPKM
jgi:hypothetical protein